MAENTHGQVPGNIREKVTNVYHDEIHYPVSTALATVRLFENNGAKDEEYRNFTLPGPDKQITTVLGMKIEHGMQFAVGSNTGKEAQYQERFERLSTLTWKVGKRVYAPLTIGDYMPQQFYYNSASVVVREKFEDWTLLEEPIEVQSGGISTLTFTPGSGLTTAATGIAPLPNTYLGASALTNDMGFFIRVKLLCSVVESL